MMKNTEHFEKFEKNLIANQKPQYEKALMIFEAMWKEGMSLGVLPPQNPMEGIEVDIKVARILNLCLKSL